VPNFYKLLTPAKTQDQTDTIYYIDDVVKSLSPHHRTKFAKWIAGRTVLIINDRGAIYKSDLEKFFENT
jgi:hypothetical protein